jgi:hypothetical protein
MAVYKDAGLPVVFSGEEGRRLRLLGKHSSITAQLECPWPRRLFAA